MQFFSDLRKFRNNRADKTTPPGCLSLFCWFGHSKGNSAISEHEDLPFPLFPETAEMNPEDPEIPESRYANHRGSMLSLTDRETVMQWRAYSTHIQPGAIADRSHGGALLMRGPQFPETAEAYCGALPETPEMKIQRSGKCRYNGAVLAFRQPG